MCLHVALNEQCWDKTQINTMFLHWSVDNLSNVSRRLRSQRYNNYLLYGSHFTTLHTGILTDSEVLIVSWKPRPRWKLHYAYLNICVDLWVILYYSHIPCCCFIYCCLLYLINIFIIPKNKLDNINTSFHSFINKNYF